jgi:hypothetical protein
MKTLSTKPKQRKPAQQRRNTHVKRANVTNPVTQQPTKNLHFVVDEMSFRFAKFESSQTLAENGRPLWIILILIGNTLQLKEGFSKVSAISDRYGIYAFAGHLYRDKITSDGPLSVINLDDCISFSEPDTMNPIESQSTIMVASEDKTQSRDIYSDLRILCQHNGFDMVMYEAKLDENAVSFQSQPQNEHPCRNSTYLTPREKK